ncbi:cobalt-precorrin-6A reductase [Roseibium litorale]|uniref:Cobalt-precorrin-6A reductase n=1 Tax=Roseibium litorale TaxID=2803841 RepID=A0ABR9CNF5_9HYPH|nr:cobalt-precorrin-6A reductase [Roseibium litorale]MBD8892418.1 cobalt-precorrin-6A reductase [Roseibium litorale]
MSERPKILVLAGTPEARSLLRELAGRMPHLDILASFAGAVQDLPGIDVPVRVGGFGGADGLSTFLKGEQISCLVDATHPFAQVISAHAAAAARQASVPLLRLERPAWEPNPEDQWIAAASLDEAASLLPEGSKPLIAAGRKEIGRFTHRGDLSAVVRMIEPPGTVLPGSWHLILEKPSAETAEEKKLLSDHGITHVVSKNSGGRMSYAKIAAAAALGLPVVMVQRPELAPARTFSSVEAILEELKQMPQLQAAGC